MPKFVAFIGINGGTVWINPDLVRTIGQAGRDVMLAFDNDHELAITGDAAHVVAALSGDVAPAER